MAILVTIAGAIHVLSKRRQTKKKVVDADDEFERLVESGDFDSILLNDVENPRTAEVLFNQDFDDDDDDY